MGLFKQNLLEHFAAEGAHMLQDSEYNRSEKEIDKYWNSFAGLVDSLMKSENISTYDARERTYDIPTSMEGIAHGKSGNENLQDTITNLINLNENFDVTHRVGFIDTKTDYGNLFSIYSSGIYRSVDFILAVEENDNYTDEKKYKIILINGKDILYYSNDLKDIEYYDDYKSVKKDFEYLMDCFKSNTKYNQRHKTYFNK